jgi:tRNA A37 threonylcarbamoyladenosine dehydratase
MTAASADGDRLELRVTEDTWTKLMAHLFPGDDDEHAAVLLCGTARSNRGTRLLVRDVVLAKDGTDYVPGMRGYRHLCGEFVTHQVRRAKSLGLAYLAVHNHRGTDRVGFSAADLASHARAYQTLLKVTAQTVGALVCASDAVAGDIWHPNGDRDAVGRTVVIGRHRTVLTPAPDHTDPSIAARYDRQALLFGSTGQAILANTKVVIVGAGGIGMLLVEYLARLGVGHIVVIDPDRVDPTNLPRLPGATRWDAMEYLDHDGMPRAVRRLARRFARHKVDVAKRLANRANPRVAITPIIGDIADDATARQALDADYMFLAADTMLARDVVNQIAHQYLIPTLQVGSKVTLDRATGQVTDVFAAVRHLGTAAACAATGWSTRVALQRKPSVIPSRSRTSATSMTATSVRPASSPSTRSVQVLPPTTSCCTPSACHPASPRTACCATPRAAPPAGTSP